MRHVPDRRWCFVARRSIGGQSSKPLRTGMLDQTRKRVGTCVRGRLQWKRAAPQRADAEILMHAQPQGAHAPRANEEHLELDIIPVASLPGPRKPSKDDIEKHNLLHGPAMPWCNVLHRTRGHRRSLQTKRDRKSLPVIHFLCGVAGTHQRQPHFDSMVGTDMSTGAAWTSTALIKGKEDPQIVSSVLSWMPELQQSSSSQTVSQRQGTVQRCHDAKRTM